MNRSVSKVNDEWFADEERVRASVGLLEKPATSKRQNPKEVLLDSDLFVPLSSFGSLVFLVCSMVSHMFAAWFPSYLLNNLSF